MTDKREAKLRARRQMTTVADQLTGQFYCNSSNHFAAGTPVIIRGRKVCRTCADRRKRAIRQIASVPPTSFEGC